MLYLPSTRHDGYEAFTQWFDTIIEALVPNSRLAEIQRQQKQPRSIQIEPYIPSWSAVHDILWNIQYRGYYTDHDTSYIAPMP